jgi:hypothetical protein
VAIVPSPPEDIVDRTDLDAVTRFRARLQSFDFYTAVETLTAVVLIGLIVLFLAGFLPWLLAGATTSAAESTMRTVGFDTFRIDNLFDWLLVLAVGTAISIVMLGILVPLLFLWRVAAHRLGRTARREAASASAVPPLKPVTERAIGGARAAFSRAQAVMGAAAPAPPIEWKEFTLVELRDEARRRDIPGRSSMTKTQLIRALRRTEQR